MEEYMRLTKWHTEPTATGTLVYAERGEQMLRCSVPKSATPGQVLKLLIGMQSLVLKSIAREKTKAYGVLH